jgi:predicted nuclease of predicted toxin-antitoxin system
VYSMGLCGARDTEVRRSAIESDRVLVTLDSDFGQIHLFSPRETPGVIRLKLHPPTEEGIQALLISALVGLQNTDLRGKLAVVDQKRIRIRSG